MRLVDRVMQRARFEGRGNSSARAWQWAESTVCELRSGMVLEFETVSRCGGGALLPRYLPAPAARPQVRISRMRRPNVVSRNGFCTSSCFGSNTCWFESKLLEYPDMNMTLVSG